jgi:serine phosphatase RsbU (regulator of sigma subunit)
MSYQNDYKPLPVALLLGLFLTIISGIFNYLHWYGLQSQLAASTLAQANMIADNIAPALQFSDESAATSMLNSLQSNKDITSALLEDHDGKLFAGWLTHQQQVVAYNLAPIAIRSRLVDQRVSVPVLVAGQLKGKLIVDYSRLSIERKVLTSVLGALSVIVVVMLTSYFLLMRIQQVQKSKHAIEQDHRQTQDSIRYASLIQNAFIPKEEDFDRYFSEHFCIWQPKDIVGGDIYTLASLRHEDEVLLMVIDCTGHGVPGAFVSMLVKAIEQQIVTKLLHHQGEIDPAQILCTFNQSLRELLHKQNPTLDAASQSIEIQQANQHAGFDGGVLYYDRQRGLLKFAGANQSLFCVEQQQVSVIKGNRISVGHKPHDEDSCMFTTHQLPVSAGMVLYLTTDGYTDQNGGDKGLPFGKRRLTQMLTEYQHQNLAQQAHSFKQALQDYQKNESQTDDITLIGVKI